MEARNDAINNGRRQPAPHCANAGALGGVVLGAWAALVPFIGPYFDFAYTPAMNEAWMWTAERGYMEVARPETPARRPACHRHRVGNAGVAAMSAMARSGSPPS
jgi:hypothetical protein